MGRSHDHVDHRREREPRVRTVALRYIIEISEQHKRIKTMFASITNTTEFFINTAGRVQFGTSGAQTRHAVIVQAEALLARDPGTLAASTRALFPNVKRALECARSGK